ncbi:MAG: helix-turn-helix domain-containing protein [Oceanicoccus sp.]
MVQAGFLFPILHGLEDSGINVNKLKRQAGLEKFNVDIADNYIPVTALYKFFEALKTGEGLSNTHVEFQNNIQLASLSDWGEMVAYAPDLLSAMQLAISSQGVAFTNETLSLVINGSKATFSQQFTDGYCQGKPEVDYVNFMLILNGIRLALGDNWDPLELHIQSRQELDLTGILQPGSLTVVRYGQDTTGVVLPTKLLSTPMLNRHNDIVVEAPNSFRSRVEALIEASTYRPDANSMASISNIRPRTFQRQLSEENTSFSQILDHWRFNKAMELLCNEEMKIQEIGERLHYRDTSNFDRAFRRWANTSPGKYRKAVLA